jgi:energy-coupling factor transport system substrate-specific component
MEGVNYIEETRNPWAFGTRQVVYAAIGAALYGVFSWATNMFPLPAAGTISFRPAVAVLIFFGVAFGPWVGLLAGLIGTYLGDALTGWGLYWNWSVGGALMGFIPGLVMVMIHDYRSRRSIGLGILFGIIGIAVGMLFASLTEILVGGIDLNTALVGYFTPAFIGNAIVTIILLPILMIAYHSVMAGRGR